MKVLYIVPRMTYGGGMPDVLSKVDEIRSINPDFTAAIVVLEQNLIAEQLKRAVAMGIKTFLSPSEKILKKLIDAADLVVLQYWQCPSIFGFLRFLAVNQVNFRMIVDIHINGFTLPQVVPDWVVSFADACIKVHPRTPLAADARNIEIKFIPSLISTPNVPEDYGKSLFRPFRLYYAGTLNYFKAHPDFVGMHEGLNVDDYHFDLWGAGMDPAFEKSVQGSKRIRYRGFSADIHSEMRPCHLLCNPQSELSYGSYDKIMKESQWMGIPVIVLKNSYIADHIEHFVNGIVASDISEYRGFIEHLAADSDFYQRLSRSTFDHTRTSYNKTAFSKEILLLYQSVLQRPCKTVGITLVPDHPFLAVMDGMGPWKRKILDRPSELTASEINYALRCEGGLIHYLKAYPDETELKNKIIELLDLEKFADPF